MSNQLHSLLNAWQKQKDQCQWVLASIIKTQGSSYRKAGAMMLLNDLGKSFGLLSGGCLEADLLHHAQKCMQLAQSIEVCYDSQDESDITWQLGLGCGGIVTVLLQPITPENNYLDLDNVLNQLNKKHNCQYKIDLTDNKQQNQVIPAHQESMCINENKAIFLTLKPVHHVVIFGGGLDSQPLVKMAHILGWHITLIDKRQAYARRASFKEADIILKTDYGSDLVQTELNQADAVIIMHHNVKLDAEALLSLNTCKANYIGILGPQHRTEKLITENQIILSKLSAPLANPIGLDLGGDLPESIALSILSQAHAVIENRTALALGSYSHNIKRLKHVS
ncbi:XdhC family protein [Litorilituus lipolyticus]|uniref:XdhC/CoxI family protein n=1 Tax=Litorilituus lipolyticus TaxID=2491017 RepID=A0A502KY61_9GAMM|nr:XdhC/CoxI family protein [Litorilituus lipolyticus]TPH16406.1 XdhC/CoxI family protein [Litorilituus lipolyticus]